MDQIVIRPILQMKKLRLKEEWSFTQGRLANDKWPNHFHIQPRSLHGPMQCELSSTLTQQACKGPWDLGKEKKASLQRDVIIPGAGREWTELNPFHLHTENISDRH